MDYWDIEQVDGEFDIAHICTPNWTHGTIARTIAERCKIVFVESPDLELVIVGRHLYILFLTQDLLW